MVTSTAPIGRLDPLVHAFAYSLRLTQIVDWLLLDGHFPLLVGHQLFEGKWTGELLGMLEAYVVVVQLETLRGFRIILAGFLLGLSPRLVGTLLVWFGGI